MIRDNNQSDMSLPGNGGHMIKPEAAEVIFNSSMA